MGAVTSWLLGACAAWAAATMLLPRHLPRRFPEDDVDDMGAAVGGAASTGSPKSRRRPEASEPTMPRHRRSRTSALDDLAVCCDLLAVAAASGRTVAGSIVAVGAVGRGPVARSLGRSAARIAHGEALAIAIDSMRHDLGPAAQPLITTLAAAASSGLAPGPALARLADAERRRARRRVETRVRRLPVLLLLPLVGLILPAFVLLTLVPVGLSAAGGAGLASGSSPMWVASAKSRSSVPESPAATRARCVVAVASPPCVVPLPLVVASQEDPDETNFHT